MSREQTKSWLHKNNFFEITPLNGWSFIYAAYSTVEVIFWYLVIALLVGLTIVNVHQVTEHYLSKPVQYEVIMHATTQDISIPDLKLTVMLEFFDWRDYLPLKIGVPEYRSSGKWSKSMSSEANERLRIFHDFLCENGVQDEDYDYLKNLKVELFHKVYFTFLKPFYETISVNRTSKLADFSDPHILSEWKGEMNEAKRSYAEYWMDVLALPAQEQDEAAIAGRLKQLQDAPISRRPVDTLLKLCALNAIESGVPSALAESGIIKDDLLAKQPDLSAAMLLKDTVSNLAEMLHFEMEPKGSVALVDWEYIAQETLSKQEFIFSVKPLSGTKNLKIKFYLRSFMWLQHILQALESVIGSGIITSTTCMDGSEFSDIISAILLEWTLAFKFSYIYVAEPHSGGQHLAFPRSSNVFSFAPQMVFNSRVKGCYDKTLEYCTTECIRRGVVDKCSCLPWNLANLINSSDWQSENICEHVCPHVGNVKQSCSDECSQIDNPCHVLLLHKNDYKYTDLGYTIEKKQFTEISVDIPELYTYAEMTKEYKMDGGDYLSLLGNAVEFWGAIDVMGLIHLVIFIAVACCCASLRKKSRICPEQSLSSESIDTKYSTAIDSMLRELESHEDSPKWGRFRRWLKGNKFYEETLFTGYAYIVAARNVAEIALWYGIISVFMMMAAYNLSTTIKDYVNGATIVQILPTTVQAPLPNVTLKMILPILMLAEYHPKIHFDIYKHQSEFALTQAAIQLVSPEPREFSVMSEELRKGWQDKMNEPWSNLIKKDLIKKPAAASLSDGDAFGGSLAQSKELLKNFTARANDMNWREMQLKSPELFAGPQTEVDDLVFKLLLLRSIKTGEPLGQQLGTNGNRSAIETLGAVGCTVEQLLFDVWKQLGRILRVQGAHARLTGVDFDDQFLKAGTFELEVQLEFPSTMTSSYVRIDSMMYSWMQHMLFYNIEVMDYGFKMQLYKPEFYPILQLFTFESIPYLEWFQGLSFATIISPISDLSPLVSVYSSLLFNEMIQEQVVFTQWTYESEKVSCPHQSQEECVRSCLTEELMALCTCVPWSTPMRTQQHEFNLCQHPCHIENEVCEMKCRQQLCPTSHVEFISNNFRDLDIFDHGLFEFQFTRKANLHLQFVETYQYSLGTFIAQIAGLLEFWVGVNMIAIIHCLTYLVKYINGLYTSRSQKTCPNMSKKMDNLKVQLQIDIDKAREAARMTTDDDVKKPRFQWLYNNKFFQTTSITGFGFIVKAQSRSERIFWGLLVLGFIIITTINVCNAFVEYYAIKPTTISSALSHQNQFQLGNFSLKFEASLMEFVDFFPLHQPSSHINNYHNLETTDHLACELLKLVGNDDNYRQFEEQARHVLLLKWLDVNKWTLDSSHWDQREQYESAEEKFQGWQRLLQDGSARLLEFWGANKDKPFQNDYETRKQFSQLLDGPLIARNLNYSYGYLMLEGFHKGYNPQKRLWNLAEKDGSIDLPTKLHGKKIEHLMGGVSALGLAKKLKQDMSKMILIRLIGEPQVQISLWDWSYEGKSTTSGQSDALTSQQLHFGISLPPNSQRTQIRIVVHSFLQMWHTAVINTLYRHFERENRLTDQLTCLYPTTDIASLIDYEKKYFETYFISPSDVVNTMKITNDNMDSVSIREMSKAKVLIHSTQAFRSNTQNCSVMSLRECMDSCRRSHSINKCGCQSWSLMYLGEDQAVCTQPCAQEETCSEECEQLVRHPCHYVHSKMEETTDKLKNDDYYSSHLDNAMYDVVISKIGSSYVTYEESYETFGSFVAKLGGLLDLWLGVNLLSITHLTIYLIKQIYMTKKKRPKKPNEFASTTAQLEVLKNRILQDIEQLRKRIDQKNRGTKKSKQSSGHRHRISEL